MLSEKHAVTNLPQDIVRKLVNAMESLDAYLNDQTKNQVTLPSRAINDVDALKVDSLNSLNLNPDLIINEETNHSHLEGPSTQIPSESCNLKDTNWKDITNPQCLKDAYDTTGSYEILKPEKKPQDYISNDKLVLMSKNFHEEVRPKEVRSPNDKNRDISECLTTTSRRTCLKKHESRTNEPIYKTVTFMDPNPAGAMAERYKLKPGQIGKPKKKFKPRILGITGWDL